MSLCKSRRLTSPRTHLRLLVVSLMLAPLAACGGGQEETEGQEGSAAETITLRYASPAATGSALAEQAEWFFDEVEARTDGQVEVERFYDASLVGAAELLPSVSDGSRVETAYWSHAYNPGSAPLWDVSGVPFLSDNEVALQQTVADLYENDESFRAQFDKLKIRPLFWAIVGSGLSYTPKPLEGVDDLKGLRLRVVGLGAEAFKARGAEPVAAAPAEVYESVQRGVLDGAGTWPLETAAAFGMPEVAKNVAHPGTGLYAHAGSFINVDVWESLPADVQEVFEEVAAESLERGSVEVYQPIAEDACQAFLDAGGVVTVFPESEVATWRDQVLEGLVEGFIADAAKSTGESADTIRAWYDDYVERLQAATEETDYVPDWKTCFESQ